MADPERGLWDRRNFKGGPKFLKSNRISIAYDLTSNTDETFMNKSFFAFLLYRGIDRFCAIFRRFGRMADFESMAVHHRLIRICAYLQNLKTISAQIISKKCMQNVTCIGKIYHRFKQNVPESESRQFGRLRLRLLARCHDSGRLRLRTRDYKQPT